MTENKSSNKRPISPSSPHSRPPYPYAYLNSNSPQNFYHAPNYYWNHQAGAQAQNAPVYGYYQNFANPHFSSPPSIQNPSNNNNHNNMSPFVGPPPHLNQPYQNQNYQRNYNQYKNRNMNFQKSPHQNQNYQRSPNFQHSQNQRSNNQNGNQNRNPHFNNQNNNPHNNSRTKNKNKNKVDKRDLPENNKFYCEVCDRGFKTDEKYQEHLGTHETCGVDGCNFTAASKLVEIHYRNFHASGIDKKVNKLQTPDDIQKYINDRKKNFPSRSNLDKKTSIEQEKAERGVSLNTREFGRIKSHKKDKSLNTLANASTANGRVDKNNRSKKKSLYQHKIEVLKNRYKKPSLLQRLLADEIRHERNIILQCVRYVVQNNFFDDNKMKTNTQI